MSLLLLLAAAASPGLAPLAPLVGHCWRGTLPGGAEDTHCFRRAGAAVVDRHEVRAGGKAVYWGETRYTRAGGRISFAYRNADGPVMAGEVRAVPGGLSFTAGDKPPFQWRWQAPRAYVARVGPALAEVTFRRVR